MSWRTHILIITLIRHPQLKLYHIKPQNLQLVENVNVSDKPTGYIIGKVLTWRSQILVITVIQHPKVKAYHLKPQILKHVEIINVSVKPTYDTSLERS